MLLESIPTESKFFTVVDLCGVFLSITVDKYSQHFSVLTWKENTFERNTPGFYQEPYFFQTLKADLDDTKFSGGPTLLVTIRRWLASLPRLFTGGQHVAIKTFSLKGTWSFQGKTAVCSNSGSTFKVPDVGMGVCSFVHSFIHLRIK